MEHERQQPSAVMARLRRQPALVAGGLLLLMAVALRAAVAWNHAVVLNEPEEFLNLRLGRQLMAGLELGPLSRYWYTGVGGPGGGGTLFLSMLYVPVITVFGGGFLTLRLMAILWAVAGVLLVAGISRELFGPKAGIFGLAVAGLAAPPAWLGFGTMARGNYVEAAILSLLAIWSFLRLARQVGLDGPPQDSGPAFRSKPHLLALLCGWALGFSVAFWPSALATTLLLGPGVILWVLWRRRFSLLLPLGLGLGLAFLPFALGLGPPESVEGPIGGREVRMTLQAVLARPDLWPSIVEGSLGALPILGTPRTPAAGWALPWQGALEPTLRGILWISFPLALVPVAWRGSFAVRVVAVVIAGAAFGVPIVLGAMGVGPASLPVRPIYFFDPRRSALVYPLALVAATGLFVFLWEHGGPLRRFARSFSVGVLGVGAAVGVQFAAAGTPPGGPYHPERYLLCPAAEPVYEAAVCVDTQRPEDNRALEGLSESIMSWPAGQRRAAYEGFAALDPEVGLFQCAVEFEALSQNPDPHGQAQWYGLGVAGALSCLDADIRQACAQSGANALEASCLAGLDLLRGLDGGR